MMERPELLEPRIVAEEWEETTVTCFLHPNKTERKVKVMSLVALAKHVQEVQRVPFEFGRLGNIEGGDWCRNGWVCVQPTTRENTRC